MTLAKGGEPNGLGWKVFYRIGAIGIGDFIWAALPFSQGDQGVRSSYSYRSPGIGGGF